MPGSTALTDSSNHVPRADFRPNPNRAISVRSEFTQELLETAVSSSDRHTGLVALFQEKRELSPAGNKTDAETAMLDASIAFERDSNKDNPRWTLAGGGLRRAERHFSFLACVLQSAPYSQHLRAGRPLG
jgi:hypothetical protein